MKLTSDWLRVRNACVDGMEWFAEQGETEGVPVLRKLMAEDKLDWAGWLVVRLLERGGRIRYAVFAAEQVLYLYEEKYPGDMRPRAAIEAARNCLGDKSADAADADAAHAAAASIAADAAHAAAYATRAASASAAAYAYVAGACAYAAYVAADAAATAADAASAAHAASAAASADSADSVADERLMKTKILDFGLSLLEKKEKNERQQHLSDTP